MKKILIIGATSSIAEAAARIWASRGDMLFLVGRNQEQLNSIAADLKVRGAPQVEILQLELNQFDAHSRTLDLVFKRFGNIDITLIAHGTLSNQKLCEHSVELTLNELKTNGLSVIALLTDLANRFEAQRKGVIAVISSVAGDRGRQSNYIYGSAKALVTAFTSGLRQRLNSAGVSVVTIKPGFVDTPMTERFKKGLLWASREKVAKLIVKACDKENGDVYAPSYWFPIMLIIKLIPNSVFKRLRL